MSGKFLMSVVIPVYNTEKYLEEAVESVINQTIGFEENIQLILVNDASSDHSGLLCNQYKNQYPDNVEYISLCENKGPSFCRNKGLDLVSGRYVVFTDSDDKWSANAFERAVDFLEQNRSIIDLAAVNLEYFDALQEPYILNIDNISDIIINTNQDYSKIRTTPHCFIKSEVAKQYKFDEKLFFREDTAYINSIILRRQRYGMLASDVIYYYRRRKDGTSIVQMLTKDKRYYLDAPKRLYDILYAESMKNYGELVSMIQFIIAYDTVMRFSGPVDNLLDEERERYYEILYNNIQHVDDKFLLEVNYSDIETKKLLIAYKHNKELARFIIGDKKKDKQLDDQWIRLQRIRCNYQIIKKMLQFRQQGKLLKNYFTENESYKIAIYGFADIGKLLYEELKNTEISVEYLIDRRADRISAEIPVVFPEEELKEVDFIVVTSPYYYADIKEMLSKKTSIPVASIEEVMGEY